jgi:hypothetical protein
VGPESTHQPTTSFITLQGSHYQRHNNFDRKKKSRPVNATIPLWYYTKTMSRTTTTQTGTSNTVPSLDQATGQCRQQRHHNSTTMGFKSPANYTITVSVPRQETPFSSPATPLTLSQCVCIDMANYLNHEFHTKTLVSLHPLPFPFLCFCSESTHCHIGRVTEL